MILGPMTEQEAAEWRLAHEIAELPNAEIASWLIESSKQIEYMRPLGRDTIRRAYLREAASRIADLNRKYCRLRGIGTVVCAGLFLIIVVLAWR